MPKLTKIHCNLSRAKRKTTHYKNYGHEDVTGVSLSIHVKSQLIKSYLPPKKWFYGFTFSSIRDAKYLSNLSETTEDNPMNCVVELLY